MQKWRSARAYGYVHLQRRIAKFQHQPTQGQLTDLAAIAHDFRAHFIKLPRKKTNVDFLLKNAAEFSTKHSIEPRDDLVMVKLLELHRVRVANLYQAF